VSLEWLGLCLNLRLRLVPAGNNRVHGALTVGGSSGVRVGRGRSWRATGLLHARDGEKVCSTGGVGATLGKVASPCGCILVRVRPVRVVDVWRPGLLLLGWRLRLCLRLRLSLHLCLRLRLRLELRLPLELGLALRLSMHLGLRMRLALRLRSGEVGLLLLLLLLGVGVPMRRGHMWVSLRLLTLNMRCRSRRRLNRTLLLQKRRRRAALLRGGRARTVRRLEGSTGPVWLLVRMLVWDLTGVASLRTLRVAAVGLLWVIPALIPSVGLRTWTGLCSVWWEWRPILLSSCGWKCASAKLARGRPIDAHSAIFARLCSIMRS
jgi:hypothetical protein